MTAVACCLRLSRKARLLLLVLGSSLGNSRPAGSLGEAYPRSVVAADEVADRLRREADRVATKAKLQSDLDQRIQRIQEIETDLPDLEVSRTAPDR